MNSERVFIVDDDASIRDALSLLLSLKGFAVSTFASAEDFLAALQPHWQGCVVVDIRMSGMSGLELQRRLQAHRDALPVVVITAHGDVAAARQAFLADAVDFIEKPVDVHQLDQAIDLALARLRRQHPPVAEPVPGGRHRADLTPREQEVLALLVTGMHNRRVAERLGISPRTVEVHKARVMEKLGARTLVELVRLVDRDQA